MSDQDEGAEPRRPLIDWDGFAEHYGRPRSHDFVVTMADGSVRHTVTTERDDGEIAVTFDRTYTAEEWAALHPPEPDDGP